MTKKNKNEPALFSIRYRYVRQPEDSPADSRTYTRAREITQPHSGWGGYSGKNKYQPGNNPTNGEKEKRKN
ncbi:MAG: hypothetical protein LBG15_00180 [Dysgonamonadaceae bacterium]|jgi:hypothetical protein|nr:hypothetical protein [Dysgonamonadaceae bacterium]